MSGLILHSYWRSSAAYRVRIALNLKGLDAVQSAHDLRTGAQRGADYLALNPQGLVPTLQDGDRLMTQSPAILEWLEERHPTPPLLPGAPEDRAVVRAMAALIGCDIHPLNNLRVLSALRSDLQATPAQVEAWIARWITEGFDALERLVERHGRGFAFGDQPTLADCYLVPQLYSAERFGVAMDRFPQIRAAAERARAMEAFDQAHPRRQPDADAP